MVVVPSNIYSTLTDSSNVYQVHLLIDTNTGHTPQWEDFSLHPPTDDTRQINDRVNGWVGAKIKQNEWVAILVLFKLNYP